MARRKSSIKALRRKLDLAFSFYIRQRDQGKPCITCGKHAPLQAGHFIKRQHQATRWDERNCHGQCVRCNMWLHGNEGAYALALVDKYGRATVDELLLLKHKTAKLHRADYEELIKQFS